MPASIEELRPPLQAFAFQRLFVEGLGWNHYTTEPVSIHVDDREYSLKPVTEKAGFVVYQCDSADDDSIPPYPIRRKIESQIAKRAFEHLIIFLDADRTTQIWQWVKRETGKSPACREQQFHAGQGGQPILQRLRNIAYSLEDEAMGVGISDVTDRVRKAFDVEKVTRRFYERFRTELSAFGDFINGISAQGDRDWYASLMLNRMMFVYFVQKQGFLDGDPDYLRNRLNMVQNLPARPEPVEGQGRFQRFYRLFLLRLFHEGLGQPEAQRAPDLAALLGKVPFLNGGLFDQHELERDNPDITIPDAAFERVFDFFDGYRWHLDERPYREDNEINPDVLGYIFEKYVNQKQMGAYYTKEDITGYISRNTVIPFLFDAARKVCPVAFGPDGGVWRLLRDDPDRYIYPAVGHGIMWNARDAEDPTRLDAPFDLPDDIAEGIDDVSQRGEWNSPAHDEYALPTETWREVVARRQRHQEVRAKLASGEVTEINDLITLNLDIERFAGDVIAQSEGPELLRAFWHAMRDVSVLDPTCGSGAFLFAALNILEPLYTACLEGMRGFLDDLQRTERPRSPKALSDFKDVLNQVEKHPSERYFILKSIVLNNLYGVDIMEEAVEICKLRLFLKLVAQLESYCQIEPLPDIDFNVRAGNTLVGFTSLDAVREAMRSERRKGAKQARMLSPEQEAQLKDIEERAEEAKRIFDQFRIQQTMLGGEVTSADKQALSDRLRSLADELDRLLAAEYGVDPSKVATYDAWRDSHQPFHWFVEFYGIMSKGGFDVVIGNPPYVRYKDVRALYTVRNFRTEPCGDLYALCTERGLEILRLKGRLGLIVPISIFGTDGFKPLQELSSSMFSTMWISCFANRPSQLFDGAQKRITIVLGNRNDGYSAKIFTSRYLRWRREEFDALFQSMLSYAPVHENFRVFAASLEKLGSHVEVSAFSRLVHTERKLSQAITTQDENAKVYYTRTFGYFLAFLDSIPNIVNVKSGDVVPPSELKEITLSSAESVHAIIAVLSSSTFFWFWNVLSDCRNLNRRDVLAFPFSPNGLDLAYKRTLAAYGRRYLSELARTSRTMQKSGLRIETFEYSACKPIIDEIDRVLAQHFGFTDEELDFIINYDIKYRMGRER